MSRTKSRHIRQHSLLDQDPLWYKSAIIYEVHVRAFCDSDADGVGDFRGLTQKLDYLQDLGVTVIWLLPFYPSPLKDDGYDIADYNAINPMYGTLADFRLFLREAHARGLRVITELVLNHTSDQHPWFQRARRARPGSSKRNYYVWNETPERYGGTRIIFKDFEPSNWTWDPVAGAYFWHRFYSHQPDLNYDNPEVHREVLKVLDFWLDMGVDGLRLDAVPYLYERENTSCENLPETHEFLKMLRRHVEGKYGDRMLLAEANQWPEEAVTYFGSGTGDECHMAYHFPLMPRLFMAVRMEDRVPIVDILEQTPAIPATSQWALFLRNHDELTLEMVTDEERDYMYRVYARDRKARINLGIRRRLAPLLGNDRRRIELLNLLLFSLPGTPVLYYGDEIGMGDNIFLGDRNGVRTPMQWSADKNAGFSRASPQALYLPIILDPEYHYEAVNVETQQRNPHSLFWWMKRLVALRKRWKAFGHGTLEFLQPENRKVLAFVRRYEEEVILVIANLSRFPQPLDLDLSAFKGRAPIELFGRNAFPHIGQAPYSMTLSPHSVFWFSLETVSGSHAGETPSASCETLVVAERWEELLAEDERTRLEKCLPAHLARQSWFRGQKRGLRSARIREAIDIPMSSGVGYLIVVVVDYAQGDPEEYLVPLMSSTGEAAQRIEQEQPDAILIQIQVAARNEPGILHDALVSREFCKALFEAIARRRRWRGLEGELELSSGHNLRQGRNGAVPVLEPFPGKYEQTHTSVLFGDQYILKLFRRIESGMHPELEIGRFLTERKFASIAPVAGAMEYHRDSGDGFAAGILNRYIPNAQSAWDFTVDHLARYFDRLRTLPFDTTEQDLANLPWLDRIEREVPNSVAHIVGTYLELARLLGQRTGELHLALASDPLETDFAPEPFTSFYQRSLYQSMRNLLMENFQLLRRSLKTLPETTRAPAEQVLALQDRILSLLRALYETRIASLRIRCHGSYHLGQVLYTGKDFVIVDFEGDPEDSLNERRIKRSGLRDVATMIRSLDHATHAALLRQVDFGAASPEQLARFEPWTRFWHRWVSVNFLKAYLAATAQSELLPRSRPEMGVLLNAYLLDKAIQEIGSDLERNPDRVKLALQSILEIAGPAGANPAPRTKPEG